MEDESPVLPISAHLFKVAIKSHLAAKEKDIAQRQNAENISGEEEKVTKKQIQWTMQRQRREKQS